MVFAVVLGATGLLVATPPAPVPPGAIPVNGVALLSVALIFVLGWIIVRPLVIRMAHVPGRTQRWESFNGPRQTNPKPQSG